MSAVVVVVRGKGESCFGCLLPSAGGGTGRTRTSGGEGGGEGEGGEMLLSWCSGCSCYAGFTGNYIVYINLIIEFK